MAIFPVSRCSGDSEDTGVTCEARVYCYRLKVAAVGGREGAGMYSAWGGWVAGDVGTKRYVGAT